MQEVALVGVLQLRRFLVDRRKLAVTGLSEMIIVQFRVSASEGQPFSPLFLTVKWEPVLPIEVEAVGG